MDEPTTLGLRIRQVRQWRKLTLREAAALAGLSFSFWGEIERGEKPVATRKTMEAITGVLRVHPAELTGQPWAPQGPVRTQAQAELEGIETALEHYELGLDPEISVRPWVQIQADLERLVHLRHHVVDYTMQAELASALIGELQGAYLHLPQHRREVLLGLITVHYDAASTAKTLGGYGLPGLAARAVQQCAEALDEVVWLGYAAWARGTMTGHLDWAGQYRRSVAAAETLTSSLDSSDALQACGMLHLSAALAAGARGDHDTVTTHLNEASALAARLDTEVGTWAHLWFGPTNVGIWKTSIALEGGQHAQAMQVAKAAHPELLPNRRQAEFWAALGRALAAEKKTRQQAVRVLVRAEKLAPQRIRHDLFVRETVADLLRQARRDAGGRELRGLAWRLGVAPIG